MILNSYILSFFPRMRKIYNLCVREKREGERKSREELHIQVYS